MTVTQPGFRVVRYLVRVIIRLQSNVAGYLKVVDVHIFHVSLLRNECR